MTSRIKAIGEIALRVQDLKRMVEFYRFTIGLKLMRSTERFAFFEIAEGHAGHTQVLALFDRSRTSQPYTAPQQEKTTIDHIAFTISKDDFQSESERLESLGENLTFTYHDWVQWRSLYLTDPEGNTVELVCHDPKSTF